MTEIPLDMDLFRKRYPDKFKKDDKNQPASPVPKGEDKPIKTHIGIEELASHFPGMMKEIQDFLRGGIERPTEFDKFIPEEINDKNTDEYILAQTAWIAKNSAYIATHLQRWMGEKIVDEIEYGYRVMSNPFTGRVMEIIPACEGIVNVLPSRLPAFQQRFREKYEQLLSVAKKADEEETRRFVTGINSFKLAAMGLNEIVMMIYSEAFVALPELLNQKDSGKAGGGKNGGQSIDSQNKQEDIIELKPNFCGIGLNINALIRKIRKIKWGIKIKNLLKAFIRILLHK